MNVGAISYTELQVTMTESIAFSSALFSYDNFLVKSTLKNCETHEKKQNVVTPFY